MREHSLGRQGGGGPGGRGDALGEHSGRASGALCTARGGGQGRTARCRGAWCGDRRAREREGAFGQVTQGGAREGGGGRGASRGGGKGGKGARGYDQSDGGGGGEGGAGAGGRCSGGGEE